MTIRIFISTICAVTVTIASMGGENDTAKVNGSPRSLATYSLALDEIDKATVVLGSAYQGLASAPTYAVFDARCNSLRGDKHETVMKVQAQLVNCLNVIEKEPTTRAASLADSLVQQNKGFLMPHLQQRWFSARQRIPRQ